MKHSEIFRSSLRLFTLLGCGTPGHIEQHGRDVVNADGQCTGRAIYTDLSHYTSWLEKSILRLEEFEAIGKSGYL